MTIKQITITISQSFPNFCSGGLKIRLKTGHSTHTFYTILQIYGPSHEHLHSRDTLKEQFAV